MEKEGLSRIITSLIILVVIIAVVIFALLGFIIKQAIESSVDIVQQNSDLEILYESVVYDGNNLRLSVKSNTDKDLIRLKFIIENGAGDIYVHEENTTMKKGEVEDFVILTSGNIEKITKISVFPIFRIKDSDEVKVGDATIHNLDELQQSGQTSTNLNLNGEETSLISEDQTSTSQTKNQCNDGIDNDSDGFIDWPIDPGCSSTNDNDESNAISGIVPILNVSRTTCVAPCGVFFDSINTQGLLNGDFVNAYFSWDFDSTNVDPSNSRKTATGFVAGHVFENPGNYKVSVNARDSSASGSSSITIEVLPEPVGGWTTYCVSNSGTDTSCATGATALKTFDEAIGVLGSNVKILFKRGDSWNYNDKTIKDLNGPVILGAYGFGARPRFTYIGPIGTSTTLRFFNSKDVRLVDLHFDANNAGFSGIIFGQESSNALVQRLDVEKTNGGNVFLLGGTNNYFIVDSIIHDFSSYGVFGEAQRFAFINNTIKEIYGNEHGVRVASGQKSFINKNTILGNESKSSIQIRGKGSITRNDYVVISDNFIDLSIGAQPQNGGSEEYLSYILIERNKRILNLNDLTTTTAFNINADNVVIRNNLVHNIVNLVGLNTHPIIGLSNKIDIYGNSHFAQGISANRILNGDGTNITIKNNLLYGDSNGGLYSGTSQITSSNNILYLPNDPLSCLDPLGNTNCVDPKFLSITPASSDFLKLQSESPAIDSGTSYNGLFSDYYGNSRPKGNNIDVGAYESPYVASSSQEICGNEVINVGEECDGSDFGTYGNGIDQCLIYDSQFSSGSLFCSIDCTISTTKCVITPPSGLLLHYKFDDSPSDGILDSSGNGLDGLCTSCPILFPNGGVDGGSYNFSKVQGTFINVNNSLIDFSNDFTVAGWIKIWNESGSMGILHKLEGPGSNSLVIHITSTEAFSFRTDNGITSNTLTGNASYFDIDSQGTQWKFFALKLNGTVKTIFEDGIPVNTNANGFVGNGVADFDIGRWFAGNTLDGELDDLRIYGRALSDQEILSLYNSYSLALSPPYRENLFNRFINWIGSFFNF